MSRPEAFADLPDWAAWIAQDASGTWWAYEVQPQEYDSGWYENELGRYLQICESEPNPDWRSTLKSVRKDL